MPFNSDKTFRNTKILLAIISSYFLFNSVSIELQVDLSKISKPEHNLKLI